MYKELKVTTKLFTGRALRDLILIQMQNISLQTSFGYAHAHAPLFLIFLPHFFPCCAGHLVGFILVGKVFEKAFRILGLDERKGTWVVEQHFCGNFQVNVKWFFA